MQRYDGKVCVVTASTAGIGYAIAERLASEGAKVMVSSRKQDAVDAAVGKIRQIPGVKSANIAGVVCHVNNPEHRKNLFEKTKEAFGATIDVLVLNAAASTHFGDTMKTSDRSFDKMFETNVKSTFQLARDAMPYLTPSSFKSSAGEFTTNIILIASFAGFHPAAPIGIYGVTKTTMFGLTRAMAKDFAKRGIRVNCIAPGIIRTSFSAPLVESFEAGNPVTPEVTNVCWMSRVGESQEIASAVAFLSSADGSYMTGEIMVVAGGPARL